jgi:hypothetical protein
MHSISNSTRWSSPKKKKTCSTSNSHAKSQKTLNCRIQDQKEYKYTYYTPSSNVTLNFQFRKVWSSPLTTRMAKECSPSRRQPSTGASCTHSADAALPPPPHPHSTCVSPLPCPSASTTRRRTTIATTTRSTTLSTQTLTPAITRSTTARLHTATVTRMSPSNTSTVGITGITTRRSLVTRMRVAIPEPDEDIGDNCKFVICKCIVRFLFQTWQEQQNGSHLTGAADR